MLKGGADSPAGLARRLMTPGPRGIPPLLSGGRPPVVSAEGIIIDDGDLSGIDKLLRVLASRYGPETEELALFYLKAFFSDLRRKSGEGWGSWI